MQVRLGQLRATDPGVAALPRGLGRGLPTLVTSAAEAEVLIGAAVRQFNFLTRQRGEAYLESVRATLGAPPVREAAAYPSACLNAAPSGIKLLVAPTSICSSFLSLSTRAPHRGQS